MAITEPQSLDNTIKKKLKNKYQSPDNDKLELLGDAVLELLVSDTLYTKNLSVGKMSKVRQAIVRNVSLICLMNDRKLCDVNTYITKSCADTFEAIIGAVYIHLNQYDVNPIKIMNQWLGDIWNMENLINDLINHPNDENICTAIHRSYDEFISFSPPNLNYIKNPHDKLLKIYEYYKLGKLQLNAQKQRNLWVVKIVCPLTLGCQYYNEKDKNNIYLSVQTDINKQIAIEKASQEAIDIILNDYKLT